MLAHCAQPRIRRTAFIHLPELPENTSPHSPVFPEVPEITLLRLPQNTREPEITGIAALAIFAANQSGRSRPWCHMNCLRHVTGRFAISGNCGEVSGNCGELEIFAL
jgi:hypothetical protein